jgi:anthranilate phosphoribosyltransferase
MTHPNSMQPFIKLVGTGPHSNRHLTRPEAHDAFALILDGHATPTQLGAFLLGARVQGESSDELLGFIDAIRERATTIKPDRPNLVDIGNPYDGRTESLYTTVAAALVATAAGVPVLLHGSGPMPPKTGLALVDLLDALDLPTQQPPDAVRDQIEHSGFAYLDARQFAPAIFALRDVRTEIGIRTVFNTLEKLYDLAHAPHHVIGVTHTPYIERIVGLMQGHHWPRSLIIQGLEGAAEVTTARPTRIIEVTPDTTHESRLDPQSLGLRPIDNDALKVGPDPQTHARRLRRVLEGDDTGPLRDVIALNAALIIWTTGDPSTLPDALKRAGNALDTGAAAAVLAITAAARR